jgi:hypothetical protein
LPGTTRPGVEQLLVAEALGAAASRSVCQPAGREADAVRAADLVAEAAVAQVLARRCGRRAVPEHPFVVGRGLLEQRPEPLAPAALGLAAGARLLVLEHDAELVGEELDGFGELEVLLALHEAEEVAALAAAEAVVELLGGVDRERRGLLLVEGQQPM